MAQETHTSPERAPKPGDRRFTDQPFEFQKGVAISTWQNSGGEDTNWDDFSRATGKLCGLYPNIMGRTRNDECSDFWNECDLGGASRRRT